MKYIIVAGYLNPYGSNVEDIQKLVNEKLDRGYLLYGDLVHIQDNKYSQAMVKEK